MSEPGRGRGKKVVAPRGKGRRSQVEREQISQAEKERNRERQIQYEREQAKIAREAARKARESNRGRARGRGGYMGESRAVAGPFSAGSVISGDIGRGQAFPRPWAPSNATSGTIRSLPTSIRQVKFENGIRPKTEGEDTMALDAVREVQDGGYISSDPDEIEEGKRRNIDHIDLISDDEQGLEANAEGESSLKERLISSSMAPIRLYRREHRDRAPPINPDSGVDATIKQEKTDGTPAATEDSTMSSVKKGKQPERDFEITSSKTFQGVYNDDVTPMPIKEEPMDDVEEGTPMAGLFDDPQDIPDVKPKRSHKLGPKHSIPVLNTAEDHAEYNRYQDDLQSLTQELRHAAINEEGKTIEDDHKKDRVYLFQFPPVVPALVPQTPIVVKDEPMDEAGTAGKTTETAISIPSAEAPTATVKVEDDAKEASKRPAHLPKLASGLAGIMQVHKSGKVTLNWGGASLELHKGMDVGFLQDIVLVNVQKEHGRLGKDAIGGDAMAFGQVRGKFVVTPDWDAVLG